VTQIHYFEGKRLGSSLCVDIINVEFPFLAAHEQAVVPWIDDRDVKLCPTCAKNFHVARRKHHCRLCGAIMCHDCTQFLPLTLASMFFISYVTEHIFLSNLLLTFNIQPFKCHVSAAAGTLFSLTAHCRTVISLSNEKDLPLMA